MQRLEPIDQTGNLSEEVAKRLRSAIKAGLFQPGTHLVEQDIAEQFRVSRMPIRIAIQKLIDEGLVIKEPRRGAFVHTFSAKELDEVTSIRIALEAMVLEYAIPNWSDAIEDELGCIVERMFAAANEGDRQEIFELDVQVPRGALGIVKARIADRSRIESALAHQPLLAGSQRPRLAGGSDAACRHA